MSFLFTSESVSEGHPDKICDQVSDAVLDEVLRQDPKARVAAECFTTTGMVLVGGEITTKAKIDYQSVVRRKLREIGYTDSAYGIDADSCNVLVTVHEQSPDIAQGVDEGAGLYSEMGAGDQGIMFGYACRQTPEMMPLPIMLSHRLMQELARIRKARELPYLRPDAKAQVTVKYDENRQPVSVETVVLSTQHSPDVEYEVLKHDVIDRVIKRVIPAKFLHENTRYFVNPTGRFVIGGPHGDAGLTGRKIIVDTYGGWTPHGGGAFSGKDPSKVDRSAAYMARYVTKNIVAAELADEVELQVAYAIGYSQPVSIRVNTFGTGRIAENEILEIIRSVFDLSPSGIIKTLDLQRPLYSKVATYGHFGRVELDLPWERCDKVEAIKQCVKGNLAASRS